MNLEINKKHIETAIKIIQKELHNRSNNHSSDYYAINNQKKRVREMEFLEKLIKNLFLEVETRRKQGNLFN